MDIDIGKAAVLTEGMSVRGEKDFGGIVQALMVNRNHSAAIDHVLASPMISIFEYIHLYPSVPYTILALHSKLGTCSKFTVMSEQPSPPPSPRLPPPPQPLPPAQLVERPTENESPVRQGIFLSQLPVHTLLGVRTALVCNCMYQHLCTR